MSNISVADLKKLYSQSTTSAQMDIELCYSHKHILIRPLKVKDKNLEKTIQVEVLELPTSAIPCATRILELNPDV